MKRHLGYLLPFLALGFALPADAADQRGMAAHRRELQMQQQQDALNLNLRQSFSARPYDLSTSDLRRLDQLQMRQRMERQLLDQQQLQRGFQARQDAAHLPPEIRHQRLEHERQTFATERELQSQQFELEQRRLLQSMPRAPLQPPVGNPQLDLQ
jgi:hypothetical protein